MDGSVTTEHGVVVERHPELDGPEHRAAQARALADIRENLDGWVEVVDRAAAGPGMPQPYRLGRELRWIDEHLASIEELLRSLHLPEAPEGRAAEAPGGPAHLAPAELRDRHLAVWRRVHAVRSRCEAHLARVSGPSSVATSLVTENGRFRAGVGNLSRK